MTSVYPDAGVGALGAAIRWLESVILGSVAAIICTIAVAGLGFAMLSGRLEPKRALVALVGCFILFSAPQIAQAILHLRSVDDPRAVQSAEEQQPPSYTPPPVPNPTPVSPVRDPYAGATVNTGQ